ncbi:MAG TPA: hypothetical protein VHM19_08375, partial [Polyangiales bacterium]|nr:hypothetical protein [Polyangiales bacterium]
GGLSLELAAGLTVLPGLVAGAGLFVDGTSSPTLSNKGFGDATLDGSTLSMIGPMVDWYMRHELDGWHLQAALTLALLGVSRGTGVSGAAVGTDTGTGAGLIVGGGYEWPIDKSLAIGVLARLAFAGLSESVYKHGALTSSILCSVTWY